jgi:hypothetical protein
LHRQQFVLRSGLLTNDIQAIDERCEAFSGRCSQRLVLALQSFNVLLESLNLLRHLLDCLIAPVELGVKDHCQLQRRRILIHSMQHFLSNNFKRTFTGVPNPSIVKRALLVGGYKLVPKFFLHVSSARFPCLNDFELLKQIFTVLVACFECNFKFVPLCCQFLVLMAQVDHVLLQL